MKKHLLQNNQVLLKSTLSALNIHAVEDLEKQNAFMTR